MPTTSNAPMTAQVTSNLDASWTKLYHDIPSLKQASDVAVDGTITAVIRQTVDQNIPYTDFRFQIAQTLSDPRHLLTGSDIIIHQTGGPVTENIQGKATIVHMQVGDDPLMQAGDHLMLFLHQYAPGYYFVVGGPSGRFVVRGGAVYPINGEGVQLSGSPTETQFASSVLKP